MSTLKYSYLFNVDINILFFQGSWYENKIIFKVNRMNERWQIDVESTWISRWQTSRHYFNIYQRWINVEYLLGLINHELLVFELWGWGELKWYKSLIPFKISLYRLSNYTLNKIAKKLSYIYKLSSDDKILSSLIQKGWCTSTFLNHFKEANEQFLCVLFL